MSFLETYVLVIAPVGFCLLALVAYLTQRRAEHNLAKRVSRIQHWRLDRATRKMARRLKAEGHPLPNLAAFIARRRVEKAMEQD